MYICMILPLLLWYSLLSNTLVAVLTVDSESNSLGKGRAHSVFCEADVLALGGRPHADQLQLLAPGRRATGQL